MSATVCLVQKIEQLHYIMLHPCLRIARSIHYDYNVLNRKTHKTTKERTPLFLRGKAEMRLLLKKNVLTETGKFWLVSTWVTLEAVKNAHLFQKKILDNAVRSFINQIIV